MCKEATMSTSKSNKTTASRSAKRARFAEQEAKSGGASPMVLIAGLAIVLAIIGGIAFVLTGLSPTVANTQADSPATSLTPNRTGSQGLLVSAATHGHDPYPLVAAENGQVRLPLSTFDDYKAHHYTYMHEGSSIEFFVLKSKDGTVRAAFNACDVCYAAKKGYTQDGDYMICNNCGRRFPADQINVLQGGCNPSPLDRTVEGDTLIIEEKDIKAGMGYF
jgi:hypothetical protein